MCLLFDSDGKFIRKIGNAGRGPNEYTIISHSSFGYNNNIYIQVPGRFLEFRIDGTFIYKFNIAKTDSEDFYVSSWRLLNDSIFLGQTPLITGKETTKAIVFNNNGLIIKESRNYISLERSQRMFMSDDSQASLYSYKGRIFYKEKMNDTLFYLNDNYELLPRLSFKLGKYLMPKELREVVSPAADPPPWYDYIFINNVFEISDYLMFDCQFNRYNPAKRLTPRIVMGREIWTNTLNVLGIYEKNRKSLVFCLPTSTDNPLFTSGYYNDIDGGPRFYPLKQVDDSTIVMWIEAKLLKDHVASNDFKSSAPLYPEKKINLEVFSNRLSEFDNPVIMIVTFKSNK